MKHKKSAIIILLCIMIISGVLIGQLVVKDKDITAESPAIPNSEDSSVTNSPVSSSTSHIISASINSSQDATLKHPSPTLTSFKGTVKEVPYYLLATVNDPMHSLSWSHAKVQAERAWDLSTGSDAITVAVIDTGFALSHEDLANRWAINEDEYGMTQEGDACWTGTPADKSTNHCDDDNNNYIDDWRGYDFFNEDNTPQAGEINPEGGGTDHGSMVAGVIGATANNGVGSSGIDQSVHIMPLQVFSDDAEAYTSDIVAAIDYATDNGASVINLSLGTNMYDSVLLSAIQRAKNNGVLVVAASGNCALNDEPICNNLPTPGRMTYPALYNESFAVGATTSSDVRANYSSYGSKLDVVAPGSSVGPLPIYNNNQPGSYAYASGTSFAAPLVAGITTLLIAQNPNLSVEQIEQIVIRSTDKLSSMNNYVYTTELGYGRVNAHKATLLGLAITQTSFLGDRSLSQHEQAIGHIWRSNDSNIGDDEFILIGCRVRGGAVCSATVENGQIYRFNAQYNLKGEELQYIFIKGDQAPSGTWSVAVHDNEYASSIGSLNR